MRAPYLLVIPALLSFGLHSMAPRLMADVVLGQVDDFEDGTTFGWKHGISNPNAPHVIPDGGPEGEGDAFLHVSSNGGFGAGGKLIMFNDQPRWTGSYGDRSAPEFVAVLEADFNNLGEVPLTLWLGFDGEYTADGGSVSGSVYTSRIELPPESGWQHASFSLFPEDVTSTVDVSEILNNVTKVWLFHNAAEPVHPAPPVEAALGMDNLTAVGLSVETLPGDYNGNGRVEQADLDLVLLNWGSSFEILPTDWVHQLPEEGIVDQAELDGVLLNWGNAAGIGTAAVPEPAAWILLALVAGLGSRRAIRLIGSASAPAVVRPR